MRKKISLIAGLAALAALASPAVAAAPNPPEIARQAFADPLRPMADANVQLAALDVVRPAVNAGDIQTVQYHRNWRHPHWRHPHWRHPHWRHPHWRHRHWRHHHRW